jgi:hypothetical protein
MILAMITLRTRGHVGMLYALNIIYNTGRHNNEQGSKGKGERGKGKGERGKEKA